MRVLDIVLLSTPAETIVVAPADAALDASLPRATANRAGLALRQHAGNARAISDLRSFWVRHGGGGRRTSNPETAELVDLAVRGINIGRFTAFGFAVPMEVIPSNLAGARAVTIERVQQLNLRRAGVGDALPSTTGQGGTLTAETIAQALSSAKGGATGLDVPRLALADRIYICFEKAQPRVPSAMRAVVRQFIEDPSKVGTVVALMVVWAGAHSVAVGEVMDSTAFASLLAAAILEGAGLTMSFFALMDAVKFLVSFLRKVVAARREADLDEAAADLAKAIAAVGIQLILVTAARASAKLKTSAVKVGKSSGTLSEKEATSLKQRMAQNLHPG